MKTRSKCQHLKGWVFKRLPDGSVRRTCRVRTCRKTITEVAQGKGIIISPMKGNYSKKRKHA